MTFAINAALLSYLNRVPLSELALGLIQARGRNIRMRSGKSSSVKTAGLDNTLKPDINSALPDWLTTDQVETIKLLHDGMFGSQLGVISGNLAIFRFGTPGSTDKSRLILLGLQLIGLVVSELYPANQLTGSELRTLVQLTMGQTLQEAATDDNVSYETKRSHLKTVFSKTGTRRQAEITGTLLSHILINFGSVTQRSKIDDRHEIFYQYIQECLPEDTRHHILVNESGEQTRFLDFGPVTGTPVIYLHHIGIVYFSEDEIQHLTERNLRLICPLRNGALSKKDEPLSVDSHMAQAIEGIRMAQKMFSGAHLTLVCPLSSCFYALEFQRQYASEVENIVFVGAVYRAMARATKAEIFRNYIFSIALKNNWLLDKLTQYLVDQTDKPNTIKLLFEKIYEDSPLDLDILKDDYSDPALAYAFEYRIKNSLTSAQHDIYHQAKQNWSNLCLDDTRLHFIHGEQDELHPISSIKDFASRSNKATVYPVPNAGSFIYHHHLPTAILIIQQIVASPAQQLR